MTDKKMDLEFDKEEIVKAEEEYKRLELDPAQQEIIETIAESMSEFIPLSELAVKGFTWKVLKNWQQMRRINIAELNTRPLIDKINATKELIKQAKKFYVNLLSDATPQQRRILENNFDTLLKKSPELLRNQRKRASK